MVIRCTVESVTGSAVDNTDPDNPVVNDPDLTPYVPYTGATTNVDLGANSLTVNTDTLFVDPVNGRVAIGTTDATSPLTLFGYAQIVISGSSSPAYAGTYTRAGIHNGYSYWECPGVGFIWRRNASIYWILAENLGVETNYFFTFFSDEGAASSPPSTTWSAVGATGTVISESIPIVDFTGAGSIGFNSGPVNFSSRVGFGRFPITYPVEMQGAMSFNGTASTTQGMLIYSDAGLVSNIESQPSNYGIVLNAKYSLGYIKFKTNNIDRGIFNSSGNFGIGTMSPSLRFDVLSPDNNTTNFAQFLAANGTLGVGIWYAGIRATGSSTNASLNLEGKGTGSVNSVSRFISPTGLTVGNGTNYANTLINLSGTFDVGANSAYGLYTDQLTLAAGNGQSAIFQFFGGKVHAETGETVTSAIGAYCSTITKTGTGTVTNAYGLYVLKPTAGTNNYAAIISGETGIGTTTPNANAILDVSSTTKAFMPPRMTTAQKNAIASPTGGMVVYDSTLNKLCVYGEAGWETITSL